MKTIILKGLDRRGKSRIDSFGQDGKFRLLEENGDEIFVESFDENFRLGKKMITWAGWFTVGKEVEII